MFDFIEPITAVDKDGAKVSDSDGRFKRFFSINQTTGEVFVSDELDRTVAASVTITVSLTDQSAEPAQVGLGNLGRILNQMSANTILDHILLEFRTPGAKPPDAPGPPPPLRGRGRGIEAPRPPGAGDFLSETPGDAGAILLHKLGNFLLLSHIFQSNYRNNTMF